MMECINICRQVIKRPPKLLQFVPVIIIQLAITSCTGYGLIYDDKRYYGDHDTSEYEQDCLNQPTSECLLTSALTISSTMSDVVAQSEAFTVIAKTQFELGKNQAMLHTITKIPVLAMQYSALFELTQLAKEQLNVTNDLLTLANTITLKIEQPADKVATLLMSSILSFENQKPQLANEQLQQAIMFLKRSVVKNKNSVNIRFFTTLLPQLVQFASSNAINELIALQVIPSQNISALVEYTVLLKNNHSKYAGQLLESIMMKWQNLHDKKQQQLAQASIIRLLVAFNKQKLVTEILQQQSGLVARTTVRAVIIQQLAKQANIKHAKHELVLLLRDMRLNPQPALAKNTIASIKQQFAQNNFTLDNLRAQAIADIALALAEANKLTEAVHFAEQIQPIMGHIQGYTLTKLALKYAKLGNINAALLTMESIHRPVNRAACLAQISAELAKNANTDKLDRAIIIAARVNRQSWRDIANSEISITQAQHHDIKVAMDTLQNIQRSFSAVYAMARIARTLQASQNKR